MQGAVKLVNKFLRQHDLEYDVSQDEVEDDITEHTEWCLDDSDGCDSCEGEFTVFCTITPA